MDNLANHELITIFSSPLFTDSIWDTLVCTDCNLLAKFFLTNSFYLYGSPNFSPPKFSGVRQYIYSINVRLLHTSTLMSLLKVTKILIGVHVNSLNADTVKSLIMQSTKLSLTMSINIITHNPFSNILVGCGPHTHSCFKDPPL